MTIIGLVVVLIIIGILLYVVQGMPINETVKRIIYAIVLIAVLVWVAESFGWISGFDLPRGRIGR